MRRNIEVSHKSDEGSQVVNNCHTRLKVGRKLDVSDVGTLSSLDELSAGCNNRDLRTAALRFIKTATCLFSITRIATRDNECFAINISRQVIGTNYFKRNG
ncbi:hypothetical protein D3C72_2056260 [compost metagenome]